MLWEDAVWAHRWADVAGHSASTHKIHCYNALISKLTLIGCLVLQYYHVLEFLLTLATVKTSARRKSAGINNASRIPRVSLLRRPCHIPKNHQRKKLMLHILTQWPQRPFESRPARSCRASLEQLYHQRCRDSSGRGPVCLKGRVAEFTD